MACPQEDPADHDFVYTESVSSLAVEGIIDAYGTTQRPHIAFLLKLKILRRQRRRRENGQFFERYFRRLNIHWRVQLRDDVRLSVG